MVHPQLYEYRHGRQVSVVTTVVPDFEAVEMVFGLGSIVWFVGVGIVLRRSTTTAGS